jgi:JmjC domain, hydroxylase
MFPDLFADFENSIPFPELTRLDGVLNFAVHFPWNGIVPDLGKPVAAVYGNWLIVHIGPKGYNALGSVQDDCHSGSTCLHLDVTDALNILLWAANLEDGKAGHAVWDLFSPDDLPKLREFCWKIVGFKGPGDPVHSQTIYLTPTLLQLLFDTYGVRPFRIYQYQGEAVFIPAGYAHQVRCVSSG